MRRVIATIALALLFVSPAAAAPLTYHFTGTVNYLDDPSGYFGFSIGQSVPISFTIDTSIPDADPSPTHGDYSVYSSYPRPLITLNIGGFFGSGEWQQFETFDNWADPSGNLFDGLSVSANNVKGPNVTIGFWSSNLDAMTSDALGGPLDPSLFDLGAGASLNLRVGFPPTVGVSIDQAVTGIPEPGTLAIFGAGLLSLMLLARRRPARIAG